MQQLFLINLVHIQKNLLSNQTSDGLFKVTIKQRKWVSRKISVYPVLHITGSIFYSLSNNNGNFNSFGYPTPNQTGESANIRYQNLISKCFHCGLYRMNVNNSSISSIWDLFRLCKLGILPTPRISFWINYKYEL